MTPQQLKNSILQRAIEGRLVEQRPEEGTAKELLKEIQAEKAQLVKEGKIKKSKALPPITEEEKPFDIPDGWEWVRLIDIAEGGLGKTLNKAKDEGIEKPYLCSINVYWNGINLDKVKTALFDKEAQDKYLLKKGDLLICEGGEAGRSAVWEKNNEMYYQNALHRIRFYCGINPYYFLYCLELFKAQGIIEAYCKGVTIKYLVQSSLNEIKFPLPPITEQQRIVAKIEELLPLIDKYDKAYTKLTDFNTRFPEAMKKSLLQYAIQGKLVEQRADEGTAQDLIKDIQAEKKRLIDEKKIKKPKALPPITEEEIPFDIPESWEWVRFVDIFEIARGGSPRPIKEFLTNEENGINWIKIGDTEIGGKYIKTTKEKIIPDGLKKSRLVQYGDLLLTNSMSYGRPYIMQTRGAIHDGWLVLSPYFEDIDKDFFYYLISSPYVKNEFAHTVAGAVVKNLNKDKVKEIFIPLPPLAEQHRIVAKLEEMLPFCDQLIK